MELFGGGAPLRLAFIPVDYGKSELYVRWSLAVRHPKFVGGATPFITLFFGGFFSPKTS